MPRYVLLRHDHPILHWDLMLEVGSTLWTWRLSTPPDDQPRRAERLGDHRRIYLDYEGPVSGGRGRVDRLAGGTYEAVRWDESALVVRLSGEIVGLLQLSADDQGWWIYFEPGRGSVDSP